jgi:hypothetical protein
MPIGALTFGKTEIDEDASVLNRVVQEICGLDIAVEDAARVDGLQAGEKAAKVEPHTADGHVTEVVSKILVLKIGEDGDDLVLMSKGRDERADGVGVAEVMKQFELIEYAHRTARHVYLLDGNVSWSVGLSGTSGTFAWLSPW